MPVAEGFIDLHLRLSTESDDPSDPTRPTHKIHDPGINTGPSSVKF